MAPLCAADNNNLLAYHIPVASTETSQFVAIAQQFMQQQQQQQKPLFHQNSSNHFSPFLHHFQAQQQPQASNQAHNLQNQQQQQQAFQTPLQLNTDSSSSSLMDQWSAPWQTMKSEDLAGSFCNDLSDFHAPSDMLNQMPCSSSLQSSGFEPTVSHHGYSSSLLQSPDDEVDDLMQGLLNPASRSGSGMSCVEWLDALMNEGELEAMASCFEEQSESTQSTSEATTGVTVEEKLDGFTALQEARRYSTNVEERKAWDSMAESSRLPELVPYNDQYASVRPQLAKSDTEQAMASRQQQSMHQYQNQNHLQQQQNLQSQNQNQPICANGVELMQLLLECAKAVESDPPRAMAALEKLQKQSSTSGDPIQRLTAYFTEALAKRLERVKGLSLSVQSPASPVMVMDREHELTQAYKAMSEACPYFTFAQLTANEAILEAIDGADRVWIVDFGMTEGVQWAALLQAIVGRRGAINSSERPMQIRITAVDLGICGNFNNRVEATGRRLEEFGRGLNLGVEVDSTQVSGLGVKRPGEVVVANFMLELSHVLSSKDGRVAMSNVLSAAANLSPKVTTLAEMEAPLDEGPFQRRFVNALHFFSAMFDSMEAGMARECAHRHIMERRLLGDLIVSMIGGPDQGSGRRRLLTHNDWHALMSESGFRPSAPFTPYAFSQARFIIWKYCDSFTLSQPFPSTISLGWQHKTLLSVSSWSVSS